MALPTVSYAGGGTLTDANEALAEIYAYFNGAAGWTASLAVDEGAKGTGSFSFKISPTGEDFELIFREQGGLGTPSGVIEVYLNPNVGGATPITDSQTLNPLPADLSLPVNGMDYDTLSNDGAILIVDYGDAMALMQVESSYGHWLDCIHAGEIATRFSTSALGSPGLGILCGTPRVLEYFATQDDFCWLSKQTTWPGPVTATLLTGSATWTEALAAAGGISDLVDEILDDGDERTPGLIALAKIADDGVGTQYTKIVGMLKYIFAVPAGAGMGAAGKVPLEQTDTSNASYKFIQLGASGDTLTAAMLWDNTPVP